MAQSKVDKTTHTESDVPSTGYGDGARPITNVPASDISKLMDPGAEKRQSLQGFDDDYVDIVDYIVRSTHKIWEEKGIGRIYDHYAHNVLIHTTDGQTYGRDKVIADSIKTMSAFPDIRLYADDVIWCGNDQDGFHSSHRIGWVGTNTGYSIYGPPTGRRVMRYGIAHCFVKENRVVEEWIARDELSLIRQLGFDEHALARRMAEREAALGIRNAQVKSRGEVERLRGQLPPRPYPASSGSDFDPEDFVRRSFHEIWNLRLLNKVNDYYQPNYVAFVPTGRKLYGLGDQKAYVLAWLAAFSDAYLSVDHVCWLNNGPNGYRVATRWTLVGTHDGPGEYGLPTGKRITLLGITHHNVENGKLAREWTSFDEFALLKQLYALETAAAPGQDKGH